MADSLQLGCIKTPWSVQMSNSSRKRDTSQGPGSARKTSVVRSSSQHQTLLQESKPLAAGCFCMQQSARQTCRISHRLCSLASAGVEPCCRASPRCNLRRPLCMQDVYCQAGVLSADVLAVHPQYLLPAQVPILACCPVGPQCLCATSRWLASGAEAAQPHCATIYVHDLSLLSMLFPAGDAVEWRCAVSMHRVGGAATAADRQLHRQRAGKLDGVTVQDSLCWG